MVGAIAGHGVAGVTTSFGVPHLVSGSTKKESDLIATNGKSLPKKTPFPKFSGKVVHRSDSDKAYHDASEQYASSTFRKGGNMEPAAIIYISPPHADRDVILAIKYASENGLAIAVRTGGHQYSGASSTGGDNIQLDMSKAYKDFVWDEEKGLVTMGISYKLLDFNEKLGEMGLFVPHGQCGYVQIGGHAQTGGYGQLARSFGLFGDTIQGIRVITADGKIRHALRDATDRDEKDLFYGVLGGSPGNYGVLTHITIKPFKDEDHPESRGFKLVTLYDRDILLELLQLKADMVADDKYAADYDLCISVASGGQPIIPEMNHTEFDSFMRRMFLGKDGGSPKLLWRPTVIVVFVQWANVEGAGQDYDPENSLLKKVKDVVKKYWDSQSAAENLQKKVTRDFWEQKGRFSEIFLDKDVPTPMSKLARQWILERPREFDLPYHKRAFFTNSTNLNETGWAEKTRDRIHELQKNYLTSGCSVVVQIQHIGGNQSRALKNDEGSLEERRTAYSWRDTSVVCVLDCFYDPGAKGVKNWYKGENTAEAVAKAWQSENDRLLKGDEKTKGFFSPGMDRRMLWGSYKAKEEEFDMSKAWKYYHETPEKFDRLCAIKKKFDPHNVFTPNKFCVPTSKPEL